MCAFSLTERRENVKPRFPKEYYTIAQVEGVTDDIVREYRKMIRHEMYVDKKEMQHRAFTYGDSKDVEYLFPIEEEGYTMTGIKNEALYTALELLKCTNESWYKAVMDYYFSDDTKSFSKLANKYGVSKPEAYRRVCLGLQFLIENMT